MAILATCFASSEIACRCAAALVVRLLLSRAAMGEPSFVDGDASHAVLALDVAGIEAPIALCTESGMLLAATDPARVILSRAEPATEQLAEVPHELWRLLERSAP